MDLSKAFDTVNHSILLRKLQHYGIRGGPLNILESFLTNRLNATITRQCKSKYLQVKCGLPQGSILSPILFQIYTNDLPNVTDMSCKMYADDTIFYAASFKSKDLQKQMQQEIIKVDDWMRTNKLSLNYTKTQYVITHNKNLKIAEFSLHINNVELHRSNSVKYLGIVMDDKVNWSQHITAVSSKVSQSIGVLYKIKRYINKNTLLLLYYAFIHSHLQYGIINWGRASQTHLQHLQTLQNRALRVITGISKYSHVHTKTIFKENKILWKFLNSCTITKIIYFQLCFKIF